MERKNYNALDLLKVILITLVVAIHTGPLEYCENPLALRVYKILAGMAVPCFFIISGFLLGIHLEEPFGAPGNGKYLYRYRNKMLKMYLLGMVAYLPLAIWNYVKFDTGILKGIFLYLRGLFWLGRQYNSWQLWYLLGIVYTMCLLILLWKKGKSLDSLIVCALTIRLAETALETFLTEGQALPGAVGSLATKANWALGGGDNVLAAGFYFPIGVYLAKHPLSKPVSLAMALTGMAMAFLSGSGNTLAALGLVSYLAMVELKNRPIYPVLRKLSTAVFLDHMYAYTLFYSIVYGEKTEGLAPFVGTWVLSVLGGIVYLLFSKWRKQRKDRGKREHGTEISKNTAHPMA